jgi:hypothetical protein
MKKVHRFLLLLSALSAAPVMALAFITDVCAPFTGLSKLLCTVHQLLTSLVPVLVALGVMYFVWGVVRYVIADGEEAKEKGRDIMVFGIIGLTVIVGLWGLVNILVQTFDLQIAAPDISTVALNPTASAGAVGVEGFLVKLHNIINDIVPVLIALGVVYFVWGVVKYVIADGEEAKEKGRDTMVYGVIGFAVIIGLWGLVNILTQSLNLNTTAPDLSPLTISPGQGNCTIGNNSSLKDVLCFITRLINDSVIPFIFAIATAFFVWGAVKFFILNADEEAQRDQGRQFMIWGIVALAVMLSVWGLVGLLTTTFGVGGPVLPQVKP